MTRRIGPCLAAGGLVAFLCWLAGPPGDWAEVAVRVGAAAGIGVGCAMLARSIEGD